VFVGVDVRVGVRDGFGVSVFVGVDVSVGVREGFGVGVFGD
jgi:hypothetical protein